MITPFDVSNLNRLTPRGYRSQLGSLLATSGAGQTQTVTGNYTVQGTDGYIRVNNGATPVTITLPAASSSAAGSRVEIKVLGTGQVTVALTGSDTVDGIAGSDATLKQYSRRVYTSNGVNGWDG